MVKFELVKLDIEQYRSLEQFSFEPNSYLIIGPNGSGKTSILYALRDALYGFPTSRCRHGHENETRLFLDCYIHDRHVVIERMPGRAKLVLDDEEEVTGIREVNKIISSMLPKNILTTLILNLTFFPELSASEKKDLFDILLHTAELDKYKAVTSILLEETKKEANLLSGRHDQLKQLIEKLESEVSKEDERLKQELVHRHERIALLNQSEQELLSKIENLNDEIQDVQKELFSIPKDDNNELESLLITINTIDDQIKALKQYYEEIASADIKTTYSSEIQNITFQINSIDVEIRKMESELENIKRKAETEKLIHQQKVKSEQNNANLTLVLKTIEELENELKNVDKQCPLCGKETENIARVDVCPVCGSAIEDRASQLRDRLRQLYQTKQEFEQLIEKTIVKLNNELEKTLSKLRQEYRQVKQTIQQLYAQKDNLQQALVELQEKEKEERKHLEAKKEQELAQIQQNIKELNSKKVPLLQKIQSIKQVIDNRKTLYTKLENKLQKLTEQRDRYNNDLEGIRKEISTLSMPVDTTHLDGLKKQQTELKDELKEIEQKIKTTEKRLNHLTFWYRAYSRYIRTAVLEDVLPMLNKKLIEIGTLFSVIPQIQVHNNEFHVFFEDREYKDLSTGERRICSFLTNYVIAQHCVKSNITCFDETFDGLDFMNISRVVNMLNKMSQDNNVVVITHNKLAISLLDGFSIISMGDLDYE